MSGIEFDITKTKCHAKAPPLEALNKGMVISEITASSMSQSTKVKGFTELVDSNSIRYERLRQARVNFNLACALTVVSASLCFAGVALFWSGKLPEGAAMTAGGFVSTFVTSQCLRLNKDAHNQLDELTEDLKNEE